jgi:hypothetical protein
MYQTEIPAPEKSMVQKDGIKPKVGALMFANRQGSPAVGQGAIFCFMIMAPFVVSNHKNFML